MSNNVITFRSFVVDRRRNPQRACHDAARVGRFQLAAALTDGCLS